MKRTKLIGSIVLIVCFFVSSAYAEFFVKDYKKLQKDKAMQDYVGSVGRGIFWANTVMKDDMGKVLYCQPNNLALGRDNYIRILDDEIERHEATAGYQKTQEAPIELLLIHGLQYTFPCDKSK